MSAEVETVAAGAFGGWLRKKSAYPPEAGAVCANCATLLQGHWCHHCGQAGEDFHRSSLKLLVEVFEGLFHLDGRLWRTLPDLMLRPGRVTRAYLDGHRAPQIPPLRLFLVVLLLVFVVGAFGASEQSQQANRVPSKGMVASIEGLSPEQKAKVLASIDKAKIQVDNRPAIGGSTWLKARLRRVVEHPAEFKLVLEQWSERFAFLTLPLAAGLLSLLFVFQRRFFLFDHVIFSLHSLSAQGLLLATTIGLDDLTGGASGLLMLYAPVHLFRHMRSVYATSLLGTLLRMALLFFATVIGVICLILGLLWVGLSAMQV